MDSSSLYAFELSTSTSCQRHDSMDDPAGRGIGFVYLSGKREG